jgi:GntR family transcriptional regulator / MocR family aminotransferase
MKKIASGILPLMAVDRKLARALHRQIYDAFRTGIVDGSLRPGQRIPSTRVLASELGVSRFPVLNAYAQLLAEGYFESRVGAGTVVSNSLPEQQASSKPVAARVATTRAARTHSAPRAVANRVSKLPRVENFPWLRGWGAFGVGQVALNQFPVQIWSNLITRHARNASLKSFHYSDPMGSKTLREMIAGYLRTARSLHCEAEQVMIVSGSQQALDISARVLIDPGSPVWMEEPGYRLAADAFAAAGCRIVPVPVDREGLNVAAGIKRCRKARAAFVTPSHQFPLGVTMSASRRFQLLDWAQNAGAWIMEDDYDSEYRYESSPIASLQGLDVNARVIYIGTFSKVLFPSLRIGYVVVPANLVDRFIAMRRAMDIGPPTFFLEVLADFIAEGHFARHIRRMRVLYRERRSALVDSIKNELGPSIEVLGDAAGMHLAIVLPKRSHDVQIAERAARQNLRVWPLSRAYAGDTSSAGLVSAGLILGFGSTEIDEIPRAVRKLRNLLAAKS